jgi:hypothetical protein
MSANQATRARADNSRINKSQKKKAKSKKTRDQKTSNALISVTLDSFPMKVALFREWVRARIVLYEPPNNATGTERVLVGDTTGFPAKSKLESLNMKR